ncbi:MAG TPA: metallophosphoesterase [Pyrinomonadaceae bacterium]|nr:metallophosphoesterase [Pyrinomonadaceae bacterium]
MGAVEGGGRRRFLRGAVAAGLAGVAAVGGYASLWEPFDYELTETEVFVRGLAPGFEGFRVAQLTDVHHSRLVSIAEVRRVVELTNAARPDLVALTGDYVTSRRRYVGPCAEALGRLEAPHGAWAVLGNHDHYVGGELMARALRRAGVNVLENANTTLRRGGDELQLAGVDDWGWGKADWARALGGLNRSRPSVLLSHEPAVLDLPETRGLSLILSGHTHGGQVSLPLVGAPVSYAWKEFRYLRGLYEREGTRLYVSRGTGVVGLPLRFGARPEIAVLRLRRAPDAGDRLTNGNAS